MAMAPGNGKREDVAAKACMHNKWRAGVRGDAKEDCLRLVLLRHSDGSSCRRAKDGRQQRSMAKRNVFDQGHGGRKRVGSVRRQAARVTTCGVVYGRDKMTGEKRERRAQWRASVWVYAEVFVEGMTSGMQDEVRCVAGQKRQDKRREEQSRQQGHERS